MATLLEIYNLYAEKGGELQSRFEAAILKAAWNVLNEDISTPNHTARVSWADRVLSDPDESAKSARRFLRYALAWNTTLQQSGYKTSDSDIEYIVNSQINKFAIV